MNNKCDHCGLEKSFNHRLGIEVCLNPDCYLHGIVPGSDEDNTQNHTCYRCGSKLFAYGDNKKYACYDPTCEKYGIEIDPIVKDIVKENDKINPIYYKLFSSEECKTGIESIDIIKKVLTEEEFRGFCKGNMIKYITRANSKNGREDERKASWYASMLGGEDPRPKR